MACEPQGRLARGPALPCSAPVPFSHPSETYAFRLSPPVFTLLPKALVSFLPSKLEQGEEEEFAVPYRGRGRGPSSPRCVGERAPDAVAWPQMKRPLNTAASGLLDSPTSITPPPMLSADDLLGSPTLPDCASNPFTFSSQELVSLFAPSMGVQVPSGGSPTAFLFRPMSESPSTFDSPPSPQDSLSDQEGYLSSSSSSHSGSDSPVLDTSRRLPIFSRLSISDD
nr:PREDICTED: zinc finger protein 36, C3H1 type-like 1 [Struthio camelus australis]